MKAARPVNRGVRSLSAEQTADRSARPGTRRPPQSTWTAIKTYAKSVLPDRTVFLIRRAKVARERRRLVQVPTVPQFLDVVHDERFQSSLREVKYLTQSDTARLANLWQLCRMSEPGGTILEVGVHRGGTAIHLMNCQPEAKFIVADTFWNVNSREVMLRLAEKRRQLTVLRGAFPDSDAESQVAGIGFAHIDVVVHDSCRRTLEYVAPRCMSSAIIVVNDCLRYPWGVTEAICDFIDADPAWIVLPLYPGQAVLINRSGRHSFDRLGRSPEIAERAARHELPTFGTKANPLPVDGRRE